MINKDMHSDKKYSNHKYCHSNLYLKTKIIAYDIEHIKKIGKCQAFPNHW